MKSLEIVNEIVDYWESAVNIACQSNAENGYYDELDIVEYQNRLKKYQQIKQDLKRLEELENQITIIDKATEEGIISINSGRYLRNPLIGVDHNKELILYNTYHADTRTFYLEFKVSEYNKTWRYMNEEDSYSKNNNNKPMHRIDIEKYLDVLEIIKKKKVDVDQLCFLLTQYYKLDNLLNKYNAYIIEKDKQLTMEELLKLKQWLEVNE